ncbi:hypothetical protein SS50377_23898 [Spironucleus salmonicida]|uniref:Uncharacterized protein n=1 Tax=Spironucleus salmonicida TaxID=348837 RepID=A0A9P8LT85_9EUKA|nr:hypothetical protein SS50377_23898 [Spironucleus salmonicida]
MNVTIQFLQIINFFTLYEGLLLKKQLYQAFIFYYYKTLQQYKTKKSAIRPPRRFAEARPFPFPRAPARELLGNRLSGADSASHGTSRRCSMRSTGYRASVPQEAGLAPRPVSPRLRPGLGGRRHAVRLLSCALRAQDL